MWNVIGFGASPEGEIETRTFGKRNPRALAVALAALCLVSSAWATPTIYSVAVSPNPLRRGEPFSVNIAASPDAAQATAVIDFGTSKVPGVQLSLTKQGTNWIGSSFVPDAVEVRDNKDEVKLRALAFDPIARRDERLLYFNVVIPPIKATFAGGILTITGDDTTNTIVASVDLNGAILVNAGAVPVSGGAPTLANTTLIRMFGNGGNDTLQVDPATGMPRVAMFGGDGDDTLIGGNTDDELDGGPGNDTLMGRAGADRIGGGLGNDILIGGQGADQLFGGEGNDEFVWNPGDSSDLIEGEGGEDTLTFNGANVAETIEIFGNGARLNFTRNIAAILVDCGSVERVAFTARGGADLINVSDVSTAGLKEVSIDLGAGAAPDLQKDIVSVSGTTADETFIVTGDTNEVRVAAFGAVVRVIGFELNSDEFAINGGQGNDTLDASQVPAGTMDITLNGGPGEDTLNGGKGHDLLIGGQGIDHIFAGAGDDTILWSPGDGSDVAEGQEGFDTLLFRGANIAETINISANGARATLTRDIAAITMDFAGVEAIDFKAAGGADKITVADMSGSAVTQIELDLAQPADSATPDGAADVITLHGTETDDALIIAGNATSTQVSGLAVLVSILAADPGLDQLAVELHAGNDVVDASTSQAGLVLTLRAGAGEDVLLGGFGDDYLFGDEDDDILIGGPGVDLLDGGAGNNIVIQD